MSSVAQTGKRIALRSVGEVLTDHTGNFYELRGDDLRELGKLLIDTRGRVFEVAEAESPVIAVEMPVVGAHSILSRLRNWFSRILGGIRLHSQQTIR